MEITKFEYEGTEYLLKKIEEDLSKKYTFLDYQSKEKNNHLFEGSNFFEIDTENEQFGYSTGLHLKINEIVNDLIESQRVKSAITVIQFGENCSHYDVYIDHPESPPGVMGAIEFFGHNYNFYANYLGYKTKDFIGSIPKFERKEEGYGFVLPNLVITGYDKIDKITFPECSFIKDITIKGDVKKIGEKAFEGFKKCRNLTFEEGVEEIGAGAFKDFAIDSLILPKSINKISEFAFYKSTIKKLVIRSNIKNFHPILNTNEVEQIVVLYDDKNFDCLEEVDECLVKNNDQVISVLIDKPFVSLGEPDGISQSYNNAIRMKNIWLKKYEDIVKIMPESQIDNIDNILEFTRQVLRYNKVIEILNSVDDLKREEENLCRQIFASSKNIDSNVLVDLNGSEIVTEESVLDETKESKEFLSPRKVLTFKNDPKSHKKDILFGSK